MTVMFCDVVGSTALGRRLSAEDWHGLMERFHSECGELIEREHGRVVQLLGDGLLAYFGYPVTAEEFPRLAVTAGLEIVRWASTISINSSEQLRVRIGVHTGPVIVGNLGSKRHQESLALGETTSLAARLQEVAPACSVAISPETKRLVEGFFECQELGSFALKGFSERQPVYRVVAERSPRTRLEAAFASGLTPLVGRAAELSTLKESWAKTRQGHSSPILILSGEPGIGKSRLIHELRSSIDAESASLLELRSSQHGRNSAFYPILEALQRLGGLRHDDAREAARLQLERTLEGASLTAQQVALIGSLFGLPVDPTLAPVASLLRDALMTAVATWLVGPLSGPPRLVIIEDVHWADPSTLDLLSSVFAVVPPGVLFVVSTRPEFSPPWKDNVTVLNLERLDARETAELVTHLAGNKQLPAELVDRLAERSECIPLYLEEMTKTVLESGVVRETSGEHVVDVPVHEIAIPASLHDSLMGRLDQLGSAKPVAQLAAVLGRQFELALLEAAWQRIPRVPEVSLARALNLLVGAQLLIREGESSDALYRFRHSLIQQESYHSLLPSDCRSYHGYVAQAMLESFSARAELEPELVAHHYASAEDRPRAIEFWGKAGQRSIASSAYAEAINHFKDGLKQVAHLEKGPEASRIELDLRSGLGLSLIVSSGFASKDVEETYERAAKLCNELGDEIPLRVLYGIWAVNLVRSDLTSTTRMLPGLERLASSATDQASRLVAHSALATWSFWRGEYARSMQHCELAAKLVDQAQPKEQHAALLRDHGYEGLFYPWVYLAWSQVLTGQVDAARKTWREVTELAERIGDPYVSAAVFTFGAVMHADLGDLATAGALAAKIREICADKPFPMWNAVGFTVGGHCRIHHGDTEAGISDIQMGLEMYRATGAKVPYPYHIKSLAEAFLAGGEAARACETLQEALGMMRTNLDRNFEPEMLRVLGEVQAGQGQPDAARTTLLAALDLAQSQGARLLELKIATTLAQVLEKQGNNSEARRVLAAAAESFPPTSDFAPLTKANELLDRL